MEKLIDKEVFCKRQNTHGIVTGQDALTVTIDFQGIEKVVTHNTFKRWYTIVPQDREEASAEQTATVKEKTRRKVPAPAAVEEQEEVSESLGLELRALFLKIVRDQADEHVDIIYKPEARMDIIKYRGKNIFECTQSKKRYVVLAHPDSLTPENKKLATKIHPKEWEWALRAQFAFTNKSESLLMKAIVVDGMYFRHKD